MRDECQALAHLEIYFLFDETGRFLSPEKKFIVGGMFLFLPHSARNKSCYFILSN